jgi:uncharacterized protein YggT (Ycf19 family)
VISVAKLIDTILNLAAVLLWLSWLLFRLDPMARPSAATLAGTLKRDHRRPQRWILIGALAALLVARALVYWEMGPTLEWTPTLKLGTIAIAFRSDYLNLMLLYSALGFLVTLAVFYSWLLLLSVANCRVPETDPLQRLVKYQLGWIERWPAAIKLLLPFLITGAMWIALNPALSRLGLLPGPRNTTQLLEQAAVIGASSYLGWKYLIVAVLLFHLLNSYVYLGNQPFWGFVTVSARNLLAPLRWLPLQFGRLDIAPVVGIALVLLITESIARLPRTRLYQEHLYQIMPF